MRILYYYPERRGDFMFSWQRVHFIDELQRNGITVEVVNPLDSPSLETAHEVLIGQIKSKSYDLLFVSAPLYITKEILNIAKEQGLPSLCFRPDNLLIPYIDQDIASSFDLIWLTSRETEHLYKKWGANYFISPYAANPYTFHPELKATINKLCFIGTPYGSRSNLINTIVESGVPIDVFCKKNQQTIKAEQIVYKYSVPSMTAMDTLMNNIKFHEGRKVLYAKIKNLFQKHTLNEFAENLTLLPKVPFESLNSIYSNYSLSLSSTSARNTDILSKPVPVVNLRAFEIPMAGGLQFCRYNEELANYFEADKEIVFYREKEELISKALFYTNPKNDYATLQIKQAARRKAEAEHTWTNRFNEAFKLLGLKY